LGTKDKLVPVATAEKYRLLMKRVGVRSELFLYEEQPHGFFNTAKYDETVKEMDRFLVSLGFLVENLKD
jgi:dienelactone hydrolase